MSEEPGRADAADAAGDPADFIASEAVARAALAEIAPDRQIGRLLRADPEADPQVWTLRFASDVPGYPHWEWAAVMGRPDATAAPTVLEVGLMPGEGALVPPKWIPWSERFAEYRAVHERGDEDRDDDAVDEPEAGSDAAGPEADAEPDSAGTDGRAPGGDASDAPEPGGDAAASATSR